MRPLPALEQNTVKDAATKSDDAVFGGQERRNALFGELHLKLLEQYAPPSVVVNEEHSIVHLSQNAGRYLRLAAGAPSANLFKLIRPELQIELRTALFRAAQGNELTVTGAPQRVHFDGSSETVVLQVRRVASAPAENFYLILFQAQSETSPGPTEPAHDGVITRGLDDEIEHLKGQLATTVEQYEAANEELTTVNNELKSSVEDLSRSITHLNNLMASTDIGTVFLDRQLRIHRFTPSAQKIFNLLPSDLGRPLADITHKLQYNGLIADCEQVLDRLATIEREVSMDDGKRWHLLRIATYRTQENHIAGVVATFLDITRRKGAEDELRAVSQRMERQLQKFDTVMNAVPDFVYQFDLEGRFTFVNQSLLDLWQKRHDEAIGKNFHELDYPPALATRLQRQIEEVIETRKTLKDETPYTSAIGSRQYEYILCPLLARDGSVEGVGGVTRDITERRQAEEALRASEERFRAVADNVPQVIWTNDAKGVANYFNRRWYEYSGLSFEESLGAGWEAIVHPEDEAASTEGWQQALKKGEVFEAEYRLRGSDGEYRWFIGRNVPLRENGNVVSWFGTATDIEELKRAESKTRDVEERFRLLVEGTPDYAMFLINPGNTITYWSTGAEKVFGWSAEEAVGQTADLIFIPEDKAKGAVEKELGIALEQGYAPDRRWHLRKDRTRLWIDGIMRRLDRADGSLRGFAKIARDASDQKEAEEALRHARDEMEQRVLERTRDLVATNNELERTMAQRQQLERELLEISEREKRRIGEDLHDGVCQELTATALFLKSSAKKVAAESASAAETLEESAQIVNRNVGLTRDLARGLQPAEFKGSSLKQALRGLAEQACEGTDLKCHFKAARGTRVTDDTMALHLYRVAQEAVKNAMKHSGAKNILLTLDHNKENVCVSVQDDGKGFIPRARSKGLGLHLMRYRANVLGGELKIEKRRTGGTAVTCVIPVKR